MAGVPHCSTADRRAVLDRPVGPGGFCLMLVRAGAWVSICPPFNMPAIPVRVRAGFAVAMSFVLAERRRAPRRPGSRRRRWSAAMFTPSCSPASRSASSCSSSSRRPVGRRADRPAGRLQPRRHHRPAVGQQLDADRPAAPAARPRDPVRDQRPRDRGARLHPLGRGRAAGSARRRRAGRVAGPHGRQCCWPRDRDRAAGADRAVLHRGRARACSARPHRS